MTRLFLAVPLALACLVAASAPADAQKEPRRPKMPGGADTNDAHVYYEFALNALKDDPEKSADALYWATRIEPTWADAFYARRVALLLADKSLLLRYYGGDRRTIQSDDVKRIDSLYLRALTLNPFVSQRLDHVMFEQMLDYLSDEAERHGNGSAGEIRFALDQYLRTAPASTRAWRAWGDGRLDDAALIYAEAIKGTERTAELRADRARVLYQAGQLDSALSELTAAVTELRKRDAKELVYVYESKAVMEHSIAVIHQRLGNANGARDAFGVALQEDLSYYPAHVQLGFMAIEAKDTATALAEMDLAVQLRGDDATARYVYGFTLAATGRPQEAEAQLRRAAELNKVYAAPHYALGLLFDKSNRASEAVKEYRDFLALAAVHDLRRTEVEGRVRALAGAVAGGGTVRR
jgi:tetratricopeptide (TPR) repeat protein